MTETLPSRWTPIALLVAPNVFMTFTWCGHLKFKSAPLWPVVLASWGIAFFEYRVMVPANRWGHGTYSATQLKIMQEVITVIVFCVFAVFFLGEKLKWNHFAAFACVIAAVFFVRLETSERKPPALNSQPSTLNSPK